jgi:hypothetical protein
MDPAQDEPFGVMQSKVLGLFPIDQSFFPLKLPDLRDILADLKATLVITLDVSKG